LGKRGAGLTNSYGVPLIMPMGFLKWNITGPYEVNVEVAGHMKASVSREFPDRFRLSLVPIDMDGMSAVAKRKPSSTISLSDVRNVISFWK
jgi:hypothetical protein